MEHDVTPEATKTGVPDPSLYGMSQEVGISRNGSGNAEGPEKIPELWSGGQGDGQRQNRRRWQFVTRLEAMISWEILFRRGRWRHFTWRET